MWVSANCVSRPPPHSNTHTCTCMCLHTTTHTHTHTHEQIFLCVDRYDPGMSVYLHNWYLWHVSKWFIHKYIHLYHWVSLFKITSSLITLLVFCSSLKACSSCGMLERFYKEIPYHFEAPVCWCFTYLVQSCELAIVVIMYSTCSDCGENSACSVYKTWFGLPQF